MDELASGLSNAMAVTENNVHDEHPRFSEYKNEGKISESQRARRLTQLERQAKAREDCLSRIRSVYDAAEDDATAASERSVTANEFGDELSGNSIMVDEKMKQPKKKKETPFANYLMFSEWLVDIPEAGALSTDWVMLPCPVGKRVLVVALNGSTNVYTKNGIRMNFAYETDLPGGNPVSVEGCTMLDCIKVHIKGANRNSNYFVLDILCWEQQTLTDSDFTSRRSFLQSRLDELPQLSVAEYGCILSLPSCPCTIEAMSTLMGTDFAFRLDGLLFYYCKAFYLPGQTPLVGWLKPWMLPEILGVEVDVKFISEQGFYATSQQFIDKFNVEHNFRSSIEKPKPLET